MIWVFIGEWCCGIERWRMTSAVSGSLNKVSVMVAVVVKAEAEEEDVRRSF